MEKLPKNIIQYVISFALFLAVIVLCGGTSLRECSFAVDRLAAKLTLPECHLIANLLSGDTPF